MTYGRNFQPLLRSCRNDTNDILIIDSKGSFGLSFTESSSNQQGVFYTAKAINHINGVAVDTDGNIYIGNQEGGYIQVFDNNGTFLYGFSFTTDGGWLIVAYGFHRNYQS